MKVKTAFGVAVVGLVAIAFAAPAQARSASSTELNLPVHVVTGDMHIGGFDAKIAAANEYEVRTTANGQQYSVRKGAASQASASPDNEVGGNCGYSYVYEYGIGNRAVELYTGYSVVSSVYQWYWQVRLDDRGGSSYRNFDGGGNDGIWQTDRVVGGLTKGGARATVISSNSVVFLNTGGICYSGGPYSTTTIY